jgi:hypothetical protein
MTVVRRSQAFVSIINGFVAGLVLGNMLQVPLADAQQPTSTFLNQTTRAIVLCKPCVGPFTFTLASHQT